MKFYLQLYDYHSLTKGLYIIVACFEMLWSVGRDHGGLPWLVSPPATDNFKCTPSGRFDSDYLITFIIPKLFAMNIASVHFGIIICSLLFCSCKTETGSLREEAKKEIAKAENDFEKMAAEKGIAEAFWYYADSNAVIRRRNDSIIMGKEGIKNFYSTGYFKTASVKWAPDFIDAAQKGDLGYTFGKYKWESKDSSGKVNVAGGIFHTVW
jgi:ketosteroid isomerase-like protein